MTVQSSCKALSPEAEDVIDLSFKDGVYSIPIRVHFPLDNNCSTFDDDITVNAVIDTRTAGFILVPPEGDAAGGAVSGRTVYPVDEPSLDRITFMNPSPKALWYSTRNNANSCERRGVSKREDLLEDARRCDPEVCGRIYGIFEICEIYAILSRNDKCAYG